MRDLGLVVTYLMRHVIPEEREDLHKDLQAFCKKIAYVPPELHGNSWGELGFILHSHLGDPVGVKWIEQVARIMRDEEKVPENFDPSLPHVDDYVVVSRV